MAKNILLTGGLGYIGSHTYVALISAGYNVVILDNLSNAKHSVTARLAQITNHETTFIKADVLDRDAVKAALVDYQINGVVHFAALKAVGESVEKPLDYARINIGGLINVAEMMAELDIKPIVFSSSATVYGADNTSPMTEEMPMGFTNPYGFTKVSCEHILTQAETAHGITPGILRYFNPAGAHASGLIGEDPNDIPNNLMPYIERVAAGRADALRVWGDDYPTPDGTGVRDYIHVSDLARGHVLSLNALFDQGKGHLVNLGRGEGFSVMDVLKSYSRACGTDLPYEIHPRRPGDLAVLYANAYKAKKVLGFEAKLDLDDICTSSWNWVKNSAKLS
ncbi:MAG: UDP-glucose 4-epimerase GalE [Pseudomonadota bacterium]